MRTIAVVGLLLLGTSSAWPALPPVQSAPVPATPPGQAASAPITPAPSLGSVCNTLLTSALDNDLPVPFFANLIWQESKLRNDVVSPKGAEGIAQFMPQVAARSGLENPFDPAQALPASAKMLRHLYDRFGNLGYVAAAYNAGTRRVLDWVERGRTLPRETRKYVVNITGRSIEAWRKKPKDVAALRFTRALPCSGFPAYAALVQAQTQQAALQHARAEQAAAQIPAVPQTIAPQQTTAPQQATASLRKVVRKVVKASTAKIHTKHARRAKSGASKSGASKSAANKSSAKGLVRNAHARNKGSHQHKAVRARPSVTGKAGAHVRHASHGRA